MAVPSLVPLLGSMAGTLAGPGIGAAAASALGLQGSPAGNLMAQASPKSIGAGIASLAAGGGMDEAVQQALRMAQDQMGNLGQPPVGQQGMPMGQPPMGQQGMPMAQPPMGGMPMGQPPMGQPPMPQPPTGQPPMGQPPMGGMPMGQPPMGGMPQQGMGSPTQILAPRPAPQAPPQPASLSTGLGTIRPNQGPAMPPMMKGFV